MSSLFFQPERNRSLALLTDFYQITMAYGYWKAGIDQYEAVFHQTFRRSPFQGGFTIAAGLADLVDYLKHFSFSTSDLEYLETLENPDGSPEFDPRFLDYLNNLKFTCNLDCIPEGTVVFPYEPLLRIQGPLLQCQLLETPILNIINFSTLIATKAARLRIAAQDDEIVEFGLRRAQGIDGGMTASRAAYIGGCDSTSNVLAGKLLGIPVRGTHSHSWVMAFDSEIESFETYAKYMPKNCIFLVDTYDTIEGVHNAIKVGRWLKAEGYRFLGIRLDSGDLAYLSIRSRELLDEAGFEDAKIVASNELDENIITELKRQGSQIAVWGVGTNLVTAKDQPALDGVYKLSALQDLDGKWEHKLKLSEQMVKISNPGVLQVRRFIKDGEYVADAIYDLLTPVGEPCKIIDPFDATRTKVITEQDDSEDLLKPIFQQGELTYSLPTLKNIRARTQQQLSLFHSGIKRFLHPHEYIVGMEENLYNAKIDLINDVRSKKQVKPTQV